MCKDDLEKSFGFFFEGGVLLICQRYCSSSLHGGGGEATAVLADVEVAGMRSFCAINNSFGWQPRLRVWD